MKNVTINHTCGHKSIEATCTKVQKQRLEAVECGACWLSVSARKSPEKLTLEKHGVQLVNGYAVSNSNKSLYTHVTKGVL